MATGPDVSSPRFAIELEFVLCLSNPQYLQYIAGTFPQLVNPPRNSSDEDSDAAKFARYLAYLYNYWRTPQYSKYLTHPGAVLRNLQLLQEEQFRKDIIRPDVIARLFGTEDTSQDQTMEGTAVLVHSPVQDV